MGLVHVKDSSVVTDVEKTDDGAFITPDSVTGNFVDLVTNVKRSLSNEDNGVDVIKLVEHNGFGGIMNWT